MLLLPLRSPRLASLVLPLLCTLVPGGVVQAMPSTLGPVIGHALLCRSQLDNRYFHDYLSTAFGPAYKREGGAWWFKAEGAALWGVEVKEFMVSDDSNELVFIAAVMDATPLELEQGIRTAYGIRFKPVDATAFSLRVSNPGSTIAYVNDKSKIYCAKFKPQPVR
ncbi:hypothetical protein [Massilia sp. H6]|uniref:hypothetical protein n=1 Tax=Massilia sp. H6 TaxID=2970464 RepID=UPI002169187E|nr:hypothetical protein [Massilia sp. H6]UVW29827.1 hypothetical protein NRS07_06815 [Massilia sp. H6]